MARSAFVFDLDGTIWDSYPWYSAILAPDDQAGRGRAISRLRKGASIITLAAEYGISRRTLMNRCSECTESLTLYSEVLETISSLNDAGHCLGVVTSLSGELAKLMLHRVGLSPFFDTVVHPGNCAARKPSPLPLLKALADLGGIPATSTTYIGDTETDHLCATRAGVRFLWAAYGYGQRPKGEFSEVRGFAEVLTI